jgi:hypothetical protein
MVTPLERRRVLERFNIQQGRINALENKEKRKAYGDKVRADRKAATDERLRGLLADSTATLNAAFDKASRTDNPVKGTTPTSEDRAAMNAQMAQNDRQRAAANTSPVPPAQTNQSTQFNWLDNAIGGAVKALRERIAQTPTGQVSSLAASAPAPAPASDGMTPEQRQLLQSLQAGGAPTAMPNPMAVSPQQMGTLPNMDPLVAQATKQVSDRYSNLGVDPMDPNVRSKYQLDVERTLRDLSPTGQVGAPPTLPEGQPTGMGEAALNTLVGPGGLFGAPLPPELAAREAAMAPTQNARAVAQGREAMAAMQEPFWTLVGGGLVPSMKTSGPRPVSVPPTQAELMARNYVIPEKAPRLTQGVSGGAYEMPGTRGLLPGNVPPAQTAPRPSTGPQQGPVFPGENRGQLPLFPYGTPESQAAAMGPITSKIGAAVKAGAATPAQALAAQLRQQELLGELATLRGDLANTAPRTNAQGNIESPVPGRDIPGQLGLGRIYREKSNAFDDALYRILTGQ